MLGRLRLVPRIYVSRERPDDSLQRVESQSGSVRRMIVASRGRTRARVPFCDYTSVQRVVRYDFFVTPGLSVSK